MANDRVEMMEGVKISNEEEQGRPLFTEDEKRILEVYDRLEELQFEIALLKAQGILSQGQSGIDHKCNLALQVQMNRKMKYPKTIYQMPRESFWTRRLRIKSGIVSLRMFSSQIPS